MVHNTYKLVCCDCIVFRLSEEEKEFLFKFFVFKNKGRKKDGEEVLSSEDYS